LLKFKNFISDPKPFIARLDGNRFSNFMKGFRKPNDYRGKKRSTLALPTY